MIILVLVWIYHFKSISCRSEYPSHFNIIKLLCVSYKDFKRKSVSSYHDFFLSRPTPLYLIRSDLISFLILSLPYPPLPFPSLPSLLSFPTIPLPSIPFSSLPFLPSLPLLRFLSHQFPPFPINSIPFYSHQFPSIPYHSLLFHCLPFLHQYWKLFRLSRLINGQLIINVDIPLELIFLKKKTYRYDRQMNYQK